MANLTFGIVLRADGSAMIGPVKLAKEQMDALKQSVAETGRAAETASGSLAKTRQGAESIGQTLAGWQRFAGAAVVFETLRRSLISFKEAMIEAQVAADKFRSTVSFAIGQDRVGAEMAYVSTIARQLGLDLRTTADSYAKFAAAAKGTTLEGQGARAVFEAVSKASTVMGLSAEEARGALNALQQMLSKGTVQAEELRGQLGERIPGAFQIAARAMGVTTEELGKMLEQGKVLASDFLPRFAAQLEKELGGSATQAAQSMQAALNRMATAWTELKQTIAESGPGEWFKNATAGIAEGLQGVTNAFRMAQVEGGGLLAIMRQLASRDGLAGAMARLSTGNVGGAVAALVSGPGSPEQAAANERRLAEEAIARSLAEQERLAARIQEIKASIGRAVQDEFGQTVGIAAERDRSLPALERQLEALKAAAATERERLYAQRAITELADVERRLKLSIADLNSINAGEIARMNARSPKAAQDAVTEVVKSVEASTNNVIGIRKKFGAEIEKLNAQLRTGGLSAEVRAALQQEIRVKEREQARAIEALNKPLASGAALTRELQQSAEARLALTRAITQASVEQERSALNERLAILEQEKTLGLVSTRDYIEQRYALKQAQAEREIALAEEQLRTEEQALARAAQRISAAKNAPEREQATQEMLRQQAQVLKAQTALRERQAALAGVERERTAAIVVEVKRLSEALQAGVDAWGRQVEQAEELLRLSREAAETTRRKFDEELDALAFEATLIGRSTAEQARLRKEREIALEITHRQVELDAILARRVDRGDGLAVREEDLKRFTQLQAEIESLEEAAGRVPQALADRVALTEAAQAWAQTSSQIRDGLVSAFEDWIMRGKSLGTALRDWLRQTFNTLVLRPVLQWVFGGGAPGGGGGGILSGLGSLVSGIGSSIIGALGGSGSVLGGFASGLFAPMSTLGAGFSALTATLSGGGGLLAGLGSAVSAMGGFAAALGAAVPVIGAIVALAGSLFKDKKGFKFDNAATRGGSDGRGGGRTELIESYLGTFDFAGDFSNKVVEPFIEQVRRLDRLIAEEFLDKDALARVRERIQMIADPRWFGANSDAEFKASMEAATKQFLQERFGTVFDEVDAAVAAQIRSFKGGTDELIQFLSKTVAANQALAKIREAVPGFTMALSEFLSYSDQQQQALLRSVDAFIAVRQVLPELNLSLQALAFAAEEDRDRLMNLVEVYRIAGQSLRDQWGAAVQSVAQTDWSRLFGMRAELLRASQAFDGSVAASRQLAQLSAQRYAAEIQMLQRIAAMVQEITAQFRDDVTAILDAGRTDQGRYEQNRLRADAAARALSDPQQLTDAERQVLARELGLGEKTDFADPAVIEKIAQWGRRAINDAFRAMLQGIDSGTITEGGLSKEQLREKYSRLFADKLGELGDLTVGRLETSGQRLAEGGDTLNAMLRQAIEEPLAKVAERMMASAERMNEAAETMNEAADKQNQPKPPVRIAIDWPDGRNAGQVTYFEGA